MRPAPSAPAATLALLLAIQGSLGAQDTVVVPDTPECADCLELEVVLSFGAVDDDGALLTRYPGISQLPDGRWVVFESSLDGTIRIYDSNGSFQHVIEAEGDGPGEYRGLSRILPNGPDGYVLYDATIDRFSYVDRDFSFLSSNRSPPAIRIEALSGGSFVVNALLPRAAAQGHVVSVVDSAGNVQASFGGQGRPIDHREGFHVRHRVIAVGPDDNIWTGYQEKYELEKFSPEGDRLVSLSRRADWFEPHTDIGPPRDARSEPPNPRLRELTVGKDGTVWVVTWVADPDWKEAVPAEFDPRTRYDNDRVYDAVLEVIDPEGGRVLARTRSRAALRKVNIVGPDFGKPLYFRTIQQEDGFIRADILRPVLKLPIPLEDHHENVWIPRSHRSGWYDGTGAGSGPIGVRKRPR